MLLAMVLFHPTAYLFEYKAEFEKRYPSVKLSIMDISRFVRKRKINKKKVIFLSFKLTIVGERIQES